jgi:nucleolar protein 14
MHSQLEKRLRDYVQGTLSGSCWPSLGNLLLLQILGNVFSVTDFHNAIITSASLFLCQCLVQCPVSSLSDASHGILTATILLAYTAETKRLVPEVTTFTAALASAFLQHNDGIPKWSKNVNLIALKIWILKAAKLDNISENVKMRWAFFGDSFDESEIGGSHLAILSCLVSMIRDIHARSSASAGYPEIMQPLHFVLSNLDGTLLSPSEAQKAQNLRSAIELDLNRIDKSRKPLQLRIQGPKAIETLAPRYEVNYSLKKDMDPDKARVKVKQLNRQVKRESKAAMRELRRDADFLNQEIYASNEAKREKKREERAANFAWMEQQQATINEQVRKGGSLLKGGGSGVGKPLVKRRQDRGKK